MVLIFLKVLALGSRSSTEVRWFVTKSEQVKYVLVELRRSSLKHTLKGPFCQSESLPNSLAKKKQRLPWADKYTF